jgi:hypothetical protein
MSSLRQSAYWLDGRERIWLSRLAQPHWVTFGADTGLRDVIASACATVGFVPRAAAETSQVEPQRGSPPPAWGRRWSPRTSSATGSPRRSSEPTRPSGVS